MSIKLTIFLIVASICLILLTTYFLKKGRIPEKYAILWYAFSLLILFIGIFPNFFGGISNILGFQLLSNMILAILVGLLFLLVMSLTIMIAGQKKKTTLLIQELSILKSEIDRNGK